VMIPDYSQNPGWEGWLSSPTNVRERLNSRQESCRAVMRRGKLSEEYMNKWIEDDSCTSRYSVPSHGKRHL
jgi:hypothetical protein